MINRSSPRRGATLSLAWSILLLFLGISATAFARQGEPPLSKSARLTPLNGIPVFDLPAVNNEKLLAADARETAPGPLPVAVPIAVEITPQTQGHWETLDDGSRIWRLRFQAPGATDLNFGFTRYHLPEGARLHVLSGDNSYFEGPYTAADNLPHFQLWTPMVPGDTAVAELFLPAGTDSDSVELELTRVGTGYRDVFGKNGVPNLNKQGSCNIDVVCPEGDPWRNEIRGTARILIGGSSLCTATLMADQPRSFRAYLLTAAHCDITTNVAPSVVAYWNYESSDCGDLSGGSLVQNQTGSTFRARREDVDMSLIELDEAPDPAFNVYYSGWDRSGSTPGGSVGIHHPGGDEKAISINDDPLTTVHSCIGPGQDTHWDMNWEQGTTEGGSSGSGIWDPATHSLVGFLSGGSASCDNTSGSDCYGKLSVAWDGYDANTRLRDWLDPNGTEATSVPGSNLCDSVRPVVAAVLPTSRSVQVDSVATVFASLINVSSTETAINCKIELDSPIPASFRFWTTNPLTNAIAGEVSQGADIAPGVSQSYLLALTPSAPFDATQVEFGFSCDNTGPAARITGVNTLLMSASVDAVPDVIAMAATPTNDGIVNLTGNPAQGVFVVASANIGSTGAIDVGADTGQAALPIEIRICQTNPPTSLCLEEPAGSLQVRIESNTAPTFGIFVTSQGDVPFDPANNRVFVRFTDGNGVVRGATSVALRTQ